MLYAAHLGPVETGEGPFDIFFAFLDDEEMVPAGGRTAAEALRELAGLGTKRGDTKLLCEPSLAKAGKPFGFKSADPPAEVAAAIAMMAFQLSLGPSAEKIADPDVLLPFLLASGDFHEAAPWTYWWDSEVVTFVVETKKNGKPGKKVTYEGSLMGRAGEVFGLAMYDKPGSLDRLADFVEAGDLAAALKLDSVAMTFDFEPAWAVEKMKRAFSVNAIPSPVRTKAGKGLQPPRIEDVRLLTAAMTAAAKLKPGNLTASLELPFEGGSISVHVSALAPSED